MADSVPKVYGEIEFEPLIGPVREVRDEDQVAGARDRQKLRDALHDGENDDLQWFHWFGWSCG
jgi:hypothetical protein